MNLPDFRLEAYFSHWEFAARHHLTASDAQSMTVRELLALADPADAAAFDAQWLGYTQTFGAPVLRAEIARTYDTMTPDNVLCFAGAEEGIYVANHVLLGADDHAIVITPNYQAAETVPLSLCAVTGVPLDPDQGWRLDLDRVAAAIRPNTRLVSINFPHNPTGCIPDRATLDGLVALCRRHGIWLFSDEVYRLLGPDPARHLPQVADIYERGLSLNVLSKAYGLPGLRIGWIACQDQELLSRMERMKHYLSICNSAPSEALGIIALRAGERIVGRNNALVLANLALLDAFFADYPHLFEWTRSDGGCVGYPRWRGPGTVDAFCEDLVTQAGVLLLPSGIYHSELGPVPTDRFRIGFGRANVPDSIAAFRAYLEKRQL
ncbi:MULTISPECIES: pyridoxal phosphate-dependent aminotransferase [unclassified Novosphingobium]|uniref:pyridoxal phosphate-dependent aminotransferase n=1 Tax=unclassified Novosphingobium TaxID=2644732 RepID=UPI000D3132C9|nr:MULTISPECIES: pyridoxal phosphate-dependent aminotransferase [unclassified Novosphingobium]PTR11206.1 aspartate/methionine/tyrosine aminotransferase [Novosphingobium sp. GV055]PUB03987.1 aspartate/methionine/tyrosine aminotransferase [Novosphingobium sp. GV061]PUB20378.1 aspartate/methionine/tyrosine aminotransferase [Novosphingobium sp. GV079]PUB42104.1 aspartate/methionine/tyrosine aminotransferase [Novosphingobium sp. GV027]